MPAITGEKYILTFTDDYTHMSWVILTSDRATLPYEFRRWRVYVKRQSNHKILALRSDNAKEYKALGGTQLADAGISHELTTVYTPEQNGVSERLNRSLITMARAMLLSVKLPPRFWGEAVRTACYLRNRMAIGPSGKSPEEAFTGRKPSLRHLRTFSCVVYADVPSETRAKLEPTGRKTILVGYLSTLRQYKLYDPVTKLFLVSLSPRIEEDEFWDWSDEPEELGEDLDSFNPMEPVELDPNELLGPVTDREGIGPQVTEPNLGGEEPQTTDQDNRENLRGIGEP